MKTSILRVLLVAVLFAAGCSSDEEPVLPEIPGDDVEDAAVEESSTTSSTSTTSTTTTSTTTSTTTTLDPTALIVAEQFPGVNFTAASLPTEAGSINNNRAPAETEKDQALIAAFVRFVNAAIAVNEQPTDVAPYADAPVTADQRDRLVASAERRVAANEVLDMSGGLTVRPYAVEQEDPEIGLVWDCSIDGTVWRDQDSGVAAAAATGWPQVGAPGVEEGVGYFFERVDGEWLLSRIYTEPGACWS